MAALCNNRSHYAYVFWERVTIILNDLMFIEFLFVSGFTKTRASIFLVFFVVVVVVVVVVVGFFSGGWDEIVRILKRPCL